MRQRTNRDSKGRNQAPVALKSLKNDGSRVAPEKRLAESLERETASHALVEALEQQTATSEIRRTIAHAQTDTQRCRHHRAERRPALPWCAAAVFLTHGGSCTNRLTGC